MIVPPHVGCCVAAVWAVRMCGEGKDAKRRAFQSEPLVADASRSGHQRHRGGFVRKEGYTHIPASPGLPINAGLQAISAEVTETRLVQLQSSSSLRPAVTPRRSRASCNRSRRGCSTFLPSTHWLFKKRKAISAARGNKKTGSNHQVPRIGISGQPRWLYLCLLCREIRRAIRI